MPGRDRYEDRNLIGQVLIRISAQANFRRAQFGAQKTFLQVDRFYLLGQK